MDDDRKDKPAGRGPRKGGGDRRPNKAAGGKPQWKSGGPKREFRKDGDERPRRPRPVGDRPEGDRPKRPWKPAGDRPAGADGEKRFSKRPRPVGERPERADDRPKREWRPRGTEGGGRPFRAKPKFDGPRFEGPRGPRPERQREDRPRGFRRDGERSAETGDRPKREWTLRPSGDRPQGDRPKRPWKPAGERPAGAEDRPKREWRPREAEGGERPFRDKPRFDRPRGDRPDLAKRPVRGDRPREDRPVRDLAAPEEGERIAKRLARAGISSRRDAEEMIAAGRVRVNGKVLSSPAVNVGPDDLIQVDNELIPAIERTRLFLFHKPGGVVTTNRDPEGRKTVFDVLPEGLPRLLTVGRLDINTEGLLLLTNDGGLARVLELPATGWLRRYRVRVHGRVDESKLRELRDGIAVDGVFYGAIEATLDREQGSNAWLTLGLREGKNREVKNVLGALGLDVSRLIRVSFGPFQLGELPEGAVQELRGKMLRDQLGERLIEEAGANFEAPVLNEFSNKPVVKERPARGEDAARRPSKPEIGEGGLVKSRKRQREERRDDALGRLQTSRPPMRGKGPRKDGGRDGRKDDKPFEPPRPRSSNVWMAPGARPVGKKPAETTPKGRDGAPGRKPPRKPTR